MKPGRNDPCPCGSGKKYKKCCADLSTMQPAAAPDVAPETGGKGRSSASVCADLAEKGVLLTPYVVSRMATDPRSLEHFRDPAQRAAVSRGMREAWTREKVAAKSTGQIEDEIRRFGVPYAREAFVASTSGRRSAWSIGEARRAHRDVTCRGGDEDFLGLAACELWKRFVPATPSMEMLDDWMQEGYDHVAAGRTAEACVDWWRCWCAILPWLPEGRVRDFGEIDRAFQGMQSLFNWCQDFETELGNAAFQDRHWATVGLQYCREVLARIPEDEENLQINFRRALATFQFGLEDLAAGEATLREVVARWPRSVWGYVALGDAFSDQAPGAMAPPADLAVAIGWLERGLRAVPASDPDRGVLKERLEDLTRSKA